VNWTETAGPDVDDVEEVEGGVGDGEGVDDAEGGVEDVDDVEGMAGIVGGRPMDASSWAKPSAGRARIERKHKAFTARFCKASRMPVRSAANPSLAPPPLLLALTHEKFASPLYRRPTQPPLHSKHHRAPRAKSFGFLNEVDHRLEFRI
jgi:hypothetical protein